MIQVDSHYVMGHSHLNNEDYAISGVEPVPYMILADGCSSSRHSDIGARMLVMSAKEYLLNHIVSGQVPEAGDLGLYAALKAEAAVKVIGTPITSIDATLIVAFVFEEQAYIYMYGDGSIFYTDKAGEFNLVNVEYSHNAPYYPSYKVDKSRDLHYKTVSRNEGKLITRNEVLVIENVDEPTVLTLSSADLSSLMIASDGVSSFVDTTRAQTIPTESLAKVMSDFRTTQGDFLKRKIKRLLKLNAKEGIYNSDDLSVAAMVFEY